MIQINNNNQAVKAVGMLSGGLDSTLAAKMMKDLGFEVHGVYFAMPWGCCNKDKAREAAELIGINFITLQLDERYLEMVRKPKFGYGTALNPCVDCRIHMFSRAAQYMKSINAEFVFTGEVLGQRPKSQMRNSMKWIEENSGLKGRLLRPLSAKLLEPTLPEQQGIINREQLLELNGRSRREQMDLAEAKGIKDYPNPAGGCLLTDKNFARRMQDTLDHGYRNFRETIALKWGRHYRVAGDYKFILGRDETENEALKKYAHEDDLVLELPDKIGPTLILKGKNPDEDILSLAAGLIRKYSRRKEDSNVCVEYWPVKNKNMVREITAKDLTNEEAEAMHI